MLVLNQDLQNIQYTNKTEMLKLVLIKYNDAMMRKYRKRANRFTLNWINSNVLCYE